MYVRGSRRPNRNCNILTPTLMAVNVVSFSFSRAAQPEAQWPSSLLDDGFLTASYQQLLWTPFQSGAPSPFSLVWLSLPHLVYNSVRSLTATHQGPQGPFGLMWLYLLHLVFSVSNSNWNSDFCLD